MPVNYHVGTSGWHYDHWRDRFYPRDLPKSEWLDFYASSLSTVELNNSFYRLPTERAFDGWRDSTPGGFVFAVKVSRFITHIKRLRNVEEPLETFFERAKLLGDKLGPLLYQFPPNLHRSDWLLEAFIALLPVDMRHVFEFRDESWFFPEVFDMLRHHNICFCIYDMPEFTTPLEVTADFAYIRFHGSGSMYGGCYSDDELDEWAQSIAGLAKEGGLDTVYAYFNNDAEGFAVRNARTLSGKLRELAE